MNRREFLQSIAAFATSFAIPYEAIASAPDAVIDQLWRVASDDPVTFYVKNYGTLTSSAVEVFPSSRSGLLDLPEISSLKELTGLAAEEWRVASIIEDAMAEDEVPTFNDWQAWLPAQDEGTIEHLIGKVNEWINDSPDEHDWEQANRRGYTDQGSAFTFFRDDFEFCDELNIVIIEGDCPGSSYFAAELRMDVDDANARAKELDIPIRFAWQEN